MASSRSIVREIGTAFAVLAIYLLTVLAPLHHARATQLDFQALGYQTLQAGWVLCTANGANEDDDTRLVSKCPASGIGKQDLVEPTPAVIEIEHPGAILAALHIDPARFAPPAPLNLSAAPRAPPALV